MRVIWTLVFLSCGILSSAALAQTGIPCSPSQDDIVAIFGVSAKSNGMWITDDVGGKHIVGSIMPGGTHLPQSVLNGMYQSTLSFSKPVTGVCDLASEAVHSDGSVGVTIFKNGTKCGVSVAADVPQTQSKVEMLAKDICNTL